MSDFQNVKKFELNKQGVRDQILKASWVQDICLEHAERIAQNANYISEIDGAEYQAEAKTNYKTRTGAVVMPANEEAHRDNFKNNSLEIAMRM